MDFLSFHAKVKQVKPSQETKPNTLWVGILHHDKTPNQIRNEADLLWAKCPAKTTISKLQEVYVTQNNVQSKNILLLHNGKVMEDPLQKIASLNTQGDNLVALEAVTPSQLPQRKLQSRERTPLQPVNNQVSTKSPSEKLAVKPEKLITPELRNSPPDAISSRSAGTQAPRKSSGVKDELKRTDPTLARDHASSIEGPPVAGGQGAPAKNPASPLVHFDIDRAYVDYVCERRALYNSMSPHQSMYFVIEEADRDWLKVDDVLLRQYLTRARRVFSDYISMKNTQRDDFVLNQRAFWQFYCQLFRAKRQQGQYPHRDVSSAAVFHEEVLTKWVKLESRARSMVIEQVSPEIQRWPIGFPPASVSSPYLEQEGSAHLPKEEKCAPNVPGSSSPEPEAVPDDLFREQSPELQPTAKIHIPSLFTDASPETLEQGVDKGVEILKRLKETFAEYPNQGGESSQWVPSIEAVEGQAARTKTIVGVVGNTGSGKSSTINAILDEERLVPTNCMRACTAVVTEISYNHGEVPYAAVIEFIAAEDWRKELNILWKDLLDMNGNVSRDCANEDSEAGVAYAKIKAVYPKMTKDDMSNSSVDQLMRHANVVKLFGSTKEFSTEDPADFYKRLQFYVDSKEKTSGDKRKENGKKKPPREMEFWPLIKVVRLYVKSAALSTGAVIVDLPGVHDSNQARAAVAEGYMKQCTGLWIVAPINRAVDDKAAKSLLGDSFKRQLKMDGGFSSVTFICSKTDDISITEACDSLGLDEELGDLWEQSTSFARQGKQLKARMEELKDAKDDINAVMNSEDEQLEEWEALQDQLHQGETVYPPRKKTNKRKRGQSKASSRKKSRYADSDDDFIDDDSDNGSSAESTPEEDDADREPNELPLSEEDIQNKIAELRASKKHGRREKQRIDEELKPIRSELQHLEGKRDEIDAQIRTICISGRNQYSKGAIQQDFAAGIKELDQEVAEEEDAANFDPDVDKRDYEEVARSLPVFCVSSRGYQKLQGRFAKDSEVPGFKNVEETEIPQLQAHCQKLTEAGRANSCRMFLNNLSGLLNSLRLWSSNDGSGTKLTSDQKDRESRLLHDKLKRLDGALQKTIHEITDSIRDEFRDNIYQQLPTAAEKASNEANATASHWGSPVNRIDRAAGGLFWATYKAICRRDGVFQNAQGLHDWNNHLSEPMLQNVANPWEKCFSRRVPSVLNGLSITIGNVLGKFHKEVESRAMRNGSSQASFLMLSQQLQNWKAGFKDLAAAMRARINEQSKEINRQFVPVIADAMLKAYNDCEAESGPGQFARMKVIMSNHIDQTRPDMFKRSGDYVRASLEELLDDTEKEMLERGDQTFLAMKRDYLSAVLGQQTTAGEQLPREARLLRTGIHDLVDETEGIFRSVLDSKWNEAGKEDAVDTTQETDNVLPQSSQAADDGTKDHEDQSYLSNIEEDENGPEESQNSPSLTQDALDSMLKESLENHDSHGSDDPDAFLEDQAVPAVVNESAIEELQSNPSTITENKHTNNQDLMQADDETTMTEKPQASYATGRSECTSEKENQTPASASPTTAESIFGETDEHTSPAIGSDGARDSEWA